MGNRLCGAGGLARNLAPARAVPIFSDELFAVLPDAALLLAEDGDRMFTIHLPEQLAQDSIASD